MLTRSKRRRIEEGEEIDQGVLEQAMVEHYRDEYTKRSSSVVSMIIYRMNVWKNKDPKILVLNTPSVEEYEGRKDFGLEIHPEGKPYELLCFNQASPPINPSPCENRTPVGNKFTPHCQITRSTYLDDYVWIENWNNEHGTFVNGKRISIGKHILVDGDIIGLGASHSSTKHFWGEDKKKRGFVFKVKSLRTGCHMDEAQDVAKTLDEPSPAYLALNNVLVMDKLLKFLSYEELKTARVVNKLWMDRASRLLFPQTCAKFRYWDEYFRYTVEMTKKHRIPNWDIVCRFSSKYDRVFCEKVQSFAAEKGHFVRTLSLSATLNSQKDVTKLDHLLASLPNLEALDLLFTPVNRLFSPNFSRTFESVKEFSVRPGPGISFTPTEDEEYRLFTTSVANSFPNIAKISDREMAPFLPNFLNYPEDPFFWPRLTKMSAFLDDRVLETIELLEQNLTWLELKDIYYSGSATSDRLFAAIDRHSATLEHLSLQHGPVAVLRLPSFPKLKSLELDLTDYNLSWSCIRRDRPVQFIFPSGSSISYKNDFPQLQTLSLMPLKIKRGNISEMGEIKVDLQLILDILVPPDSDNVCKTMRWINFRLPKGKCTINNPWFLDFGGRFHRMFPHVHHPQVNHGLKLFNLE